ncbi:hypothetical protein CDD83_3087 [Cordyceps sp. RAO-2017]|nr:hypothetical protein CDD83_3087 [Cordyceps sp. RAO-2017]
MRRDLGRGSGGRRRDESAAQGHGSKEASEDGAAASRLRPRRRYGAQTREEDVLERLGLKGGEGQLGARAQRDGVGSTGAVVQRSGARSLDRGPSRAAAVEGELRRARERAVRDGYEEGLRRYFAHAGTDRLPEKGRKSEPQLSGTSAGEQQREQVVAEEEEEEEGEEEDEEEEERREQEASTGDGPTLAI